MCRLDWFAVWCAIIFAVTTQAIQCAAPPLNLPLRSLSIIPGTVSYGIPVSIGIVRQQFVLAPSLQLDTTFIPRFTNSCIYATDEAVPINDTRWKSEDGRTVCAGIYGGGFVPSLSASSHRDGTKDHTNEDWFKKVRFSDWRFMTEELLFTGYVEAYVQQNGVLPGKHNVTTSFILPDEGATFGGLGGSALSLTPESRLLETLYAEDMVPSRSWSLTNKNLCLGCIDESAYTGDFQSFKMSDRTADSGLPCLLQAEVEALDYLPDTETADAVLIGKEFRACIDPGVTFLVLPKDVSAKLPKVLGASVKATTNDSIKFEGSIRNGSSILRFKLKDGLSVNVVVPKARVADAKETGEWVLPFGTGSWGAYGEGVPVLGKPFTDSVVLRWDETAQGYGIANRSPDLDGESKLKPVGCDNFPSIGKSGKTTPSLSIIVSSIIGGFVAGLLFATAAAFFFNQGQKGVKSKYEAMCSEDAVSLCRVDTGGRTLESRMSGVLTPQAESLRESLRSHFGARSVSPMMEPYLIDDSQVYEAPEGGTENPSKRDRGEMTISSRNHR